MTVIVADSNNASYTGKISTANGFYRAESSNLSTEGSTLTLSSAKTLAVTFANAGNCQGIAIALTQTSNWYHDRSITVKLQELVGGTTWTTRATVTKSGADLISSYGAKYFGTDMFYYAGYFAFKFATPYAVNTTAGIWRFEFTQSAGSLDYTLRTSDNTNLSYVTWCDNKVTYSDTNDTMVCVDKVYVDANFSPKPLTSLGDTTRGVAVVLCGSNVESDPWKLLVRNADLTGSISITIDGVWYTSSGAGYQFGSTSDRIPYSKQVTIIFRHVVTTTGQNVATNQSSGGINHIASSTSQYSSDYNSLMIAGEIPERPYATLTSNASALATSIVVDEDVSSWSVNDKIFIGKTSTKGAGTDVKNYYTISSIVGHTINLTGGLVEARVAGSVVINANAKYGIVITSNTSAKGNVGDYWVRTRACWYLDCSGFMQRGVGMMLGLSANGIRVPCSNIQKVEDATMTGDLNNTGHQYNQNGIYRLSPVSSGFLMNRVNSVHVSYYMSVEAPFFTYKASTLLYVDIGRITFSNNKHISMWNSVLTGYQGSRFSFEDNIWQQVQYTAVSGFGNDFIMNRNKFWGQVTTTAGGSGMFSTSQSILGNSLSISGNYFDNCACAIMLSYSSVNTVCKGNYFGQSSANTVDVGISSTLGINQVVLQDNIGNITTNYDYKLLMSPESYLRYANYNSVANDNREIQTYGEIISTGTGLSDTTSHNSGFAMRFANTSIGDVKFKQRIPTGNIQNKDMTIGVWVNIASANYWSGTHTMPRLTVTYDNGTVAYAEAGQVTGWQYIFVPLTPTTTAGMIDVKFTSNTDQTGSNSYVYFDDFSALYPAGHQLNLGNMDLWFEGSPVTPMIATNLSPQDVWAVDPNSFGSSTVGDKVNKIKKIVTGLQ